MSTPYGPVEYESDSPHCPVCGEDAEREECEECNGQGLIGCVCEGLGGQDVCPFRCDEEVA